MAREADNSLYPIAVLIDELRNDDVQVSNRENMGLLGGISHRFGGPYARGVYSRSPVGV